MKRLNRHHEQQVAREADALGERSGDQRRRDDRELQLEQREDDQRDRRREIGMGQRADAREHEERARVADRRRAMLSPKARLKPTTIHSRLITPSATKLWSIVETTFLMRTMPP